jgi:hypothetical protein
VVSGWKQAKSVPRHFFTASDSRNYVPSGFVCNSWPISQSCFQSEVSTDEAKPSARRNKRA